MIDPDRKFDNRCDRITRLIKDKPGISKSEIIEATETVPGPERDEVINHLIATGKIAARSAKTRGRPKTCYWLVETVSAEFQQLSAEVGGEFDAATMRPAEIAAVNRKRRQLNAELIDMGLFPLPMLPFQR